ncbi:MAG: GGDEF domain-containing protein [Synechococcaceae cyanobacterium RL_1_2]|nr:GGDEF domain-containing protein [Synechococcaceae cyanobacterium RL_1_2]
MESFHWDKNFETGLAEVDSQHHTLVNIINHFSDRIAENTLVLTDLKAIFQELFHYTEYHFKEEEQMMQEQHIDPRHLSFHIREHERFLGEIMRMDQALDRTQKPHQLQQLLNFLINWLVYHILGIDKNMAQQIEAIQRGMAPGAAYEQEIQKSSVTTEPLLHALSSLFEILSSRNQELIALNQSLEVKVAARTEELSKANQYLEQLASTDLLTDLPNRRYAMIMLNKLWHEADRYHKPLVAMMVDADHFKIINDNYGHGAGDSVLRTLALTLKHNVRNDDIVARLGGDEFLIICPNTDLAGGLYLGQLVQQAVAALRVDVNDHGNYWSGSISMGVAAKSKVMEEPKDLIKAADQSVYVAKQAGKNCVRSIQTS